MKKMKLLFISLGCDKNLVDSEMMMGLLHDRGYEFTDNEEEADIIVINTCGFINDAKEESINTILEMAKYKENNLKALIVAGCLVERYKNEILQELPEIDAIVGTTAFDKICDVVDDVLADVSRALMTLYGVAELVVIETGADIGQRLDNAFIRRTIRCEQPHPPQPHGGGIIKGRGNMRRHSLCVHVDPPRVCNSEGPIPCGIEPFIIIDI